MPSGPRKRRAAKRKKEMEEQMKAAPPSPSPSDPPRDAGQGEDRVQREGGEEADSSQSPTFSPAPISDSAAESSKNLKDDDLVEEDERELAHAVKEVAFRPEDESEEKENSKPAEESTISVDNAIEFAARVLEEASGDDNTEIADGVFNHDGDGHQVAGGDETSPAIEVLEERNQVKQAAAEVLEGISGVDGEKESRLPDVDVAVKHEGDGRRTAVGDETLLATELLHRSPLAERRTKWWNCCGLLDFLTNPDG